jgi:hypothetical protein
MPVFGRTRSPAALFAAGWSCAYKFRKVGATKIDGRARAQGRARHVTRMAAFAQARARADPPGWAPLGAGYQHPGNSVRSLLGLAMF